MSKLDYKLLSPCRHLWCSRLVIFMCLPALLLASLSARAGVVSADRAMVCNIAGNDSKECNSLRSSAFEGRFSANLGMDFALGVRSQKHKDLGYDDSATKIGRDFKLSDGMGVRFGLDLRLYFFDWLGLAATTGVDTNTISTPSNSSSDSSSGYSSNRTTSGSSTRVMQPNDSFKLNYTDSYVGATIYIPAQKLTHLGLFLSARRMAAKKGEVTISLNGGSELKREAEAVESPREIAFGCFFSIFYLTYVQRFESWRVIPQARERYSEINGNSEGIELGISGPVWTIWP